MKNQTPKIAEMANKMENGEAVNPDEIANYKEYFDRFAGHIIGEHPDETAKRREMDKSQGK